MSTSRKIDRICMGIIAALLAVTILFMNGSKLGIVTASASLGYETRLFDTDSVHRVDIVMDDWDSFIENCESEEYSACTVVIDGEKYKNVALRAKGNTSLSSVRSMGNQRYIIFFAPCFFDGRFWNKEPSPVSLTSQLFFREVL